MSTPTLSSVPTPPASTRVLVTGGSGFIAGHTIVQLLAAGHRVRTTVRNLAREHGVRDVLAAAGAASAHDRVELEFTAADLLDDAGWAAALDGVDAVLHVASPVQPGHVEDEQELIVPARDGALRVLGAARAAGVRRVVLTSAFHAVGWGHPHDEHVFTESDWTVLDGPGVDAYGKSKTLAERAAWEFAAEAGDGFELVTVLPVAVMGPVMGTEVSGANRIVQRMLAGGMPAFLDLWFPIVDVRDVARGHLLALATPAAAGQRFLLAGDPALPMAEVGAVLRERLGSAAARVPTQTVPNEVVRANAASSPEFAAVLPDLGYARRVSGEHARQVLGWSARPAAEAIAAAGESLVAAGLAGA